ncbi:unnamed protein product [Parascedosporium putredinis]|uniref:DNA 3'-5' helicase n=1 Tax=Parascedosporium putredinis TaxID=1442378 RepID=A0A9P1MG41_9PEZI|nr:unnamed protein product [Parascedosporium putredinis]CAI8004737.1 unnamed protein product [Parascedosporium putredinis]
MADASAANDPLLSSLNAAQRRAVTSTSDTVAILAGPGSGKTHTLTARIVWLINYAGYRPYNLVVATFTVKAAREMKERIARALGEEKSKKIVLGTFHSIARRYLAVYGEKIGLKKNFVIADDNDTRAIITRICKRKRPDPPEMLKVFEEYKDHMARHGLLDYDDLLVKGVELLRAHPECVKNVQSVLIDEYQDTNGVQYELMKLFASAQRRITVVGDPDQSIYGWRSAEIRNLHRLLEEFPRTHEIALEDNYRSSQLILDASLQVIQQDKARYQKFSSPRSTRARARSCALCGLAPSRESGSWRRLGGRLSCGLKFYDRIEIKLLLDYLRVIYQPDNNDAVVRIINKPKRGVGEVTIKKLLEEAETSKLSLWSMILGHCRGQRKLKTNLTKAAENKLSGGLIRMICGLRHRRERKGENGEPVLGLVSLMEDLITQLDFREHIRASYPEEHESRLSNVDELLTLAEDFVKDLDLEEDLPEVEGVTELVTISTIHAAKGLEWPVVFVPAVYTGSLPHSRSEDDDEERRLLYVAMTRAQALLYLTVPWHTHNENQVSRSTFVPDDIVKFFSTFGPSFEAQTVEAMAKILRRKAPSMAETLKKLPPCLPPRGHVRTARPGGLPSPKRQNAWSQPGREQNMSRSSWNGREYKTTMESRTHFTMAAAALPGFTTAGAHQTALAAAAAAAAATFIRQGSSAATPAAAMQGTKRPAQEMEGRALPGMHQPPQQRKALNPNQVGNNFNQPLSQNTISELASRGLQDVKRRVQARRSEIIVISDDDDNDLSDGGRANSPPRPEPAEKVPVKAAVAAGRQAAQNMSAGHGARRPVSFHSTTMGAARLGGGSRAGSGGAIQREAGLAPVETLMKPFKPLTVARNGNLARPEKQARHY